MRVRSTAKFYGGIDEAGRGPLAGPVTAACVVLPEGYENTRITDSKKLRDREREILYGEIVDHAVAYSVVSVGPRRIERLNIRRASLLAMELAAVRVAKQLGISRNELSTPSKIHFLIDGNAPLALNCSQESIIGGDRKVKAIAAASILAKVTRDRLMEPLERRYPGYGLSAHKGYPTKKHREAIKAHGPTRIHRKTFQGVREFLQTPAQ